MKKALFILFNLLTITAMAQTKGRFEVHDLGNCKLHVYYTNDALGDASYIIEGKDALVTMEQPLFKDNVAEFDTYLSKLDKPVETRITDYHVGGTGKHDVVMVQGMPEFTKGEIYGGMMKGFAQAFGNQRVRHRKWLSVRHRHGQALLLSSVMGRHRIFPAQAS